MAFVYKKSFIIQETCLGVNIQARCSVGLLRRTGNWSLLYILHLNSFQLTHSWIRLNLALLEIICLRWISDSFRLI